MMITDDTILQPLLVTVDEALRQAVICQQEGRLSDAEQLYRAILQTYPGHPDANHNLGVLVAQKGRAAEAISYFRAALESNPGQEQCWLDYVDVLIKAAQFDIAAQQLEQARQRGVNGDAVKVLEGRLEHASSSEPGAQEKNAVVTLASEGRYVEAAMLAQEMTRRFPQHGFGWKALGVMLKNMGRGAEAVVSMQKAAELSPGDADACYNLGNTLQELGRLVEAEASYRQVLRINPEHAEARNSLGNVFYQMKRLDEAEASYHHALRVKPDYTDAHTNLGNILQELGRLNEAEVSYRKALGIAPDDADIHNNLGNALRAMGRLDEAEASYRQALRIRPDFVEVYGHLGLVLQELGRVKEAVANCQQALQFNPDHAEVLNNLGNALRALGRTGEAEASYRRALHIKPDHAEAHCNLGYVLQETGRQDEAEASYQRALGIRPDYAEARWKLAMSRIPIIAATYEDARACRVRFSDELNGLDAWFGADLLEAGHKVVGASQPFYLAYQEENNRGILSKYGMLCTKLMKHWQDSQGFTVPNAALGGVVRVGVVSAHFRSHSVWDAIVKGWFQHLDRDRFELHAFHTGFRMDAETNLARSCSASFEQGKGGLIQWVRAILEKQIDVLIYPEIGMDPMTVRLACLRLAPIQVAAWGHPETSGLPMMDYYLSAEYFEPEGAQENYTEELIRLPNLGCCYHPAEVTSTEPDFADLNIDTSVPLLLCPGLPFKYAPERDRVLVEIARRLRACRFVFFTSDPSLSEKLRQRLNHAFAKANLNFDAYCTFIPWQNKSAFYGLMKRADVFLDTIGFSGFNTAMQAVECGLPIVTREGRFMRGRLASGILRRMGVTELIASTEGEYVDLAVRLVQDDELRHKIRQRMEVSRHVLFDDLAPVRALEDFLSNAVKQRG